MTGGRDEPSVADDVHARARSRRPPRRSSPLDVQYYLTAVSRGSCRRGTSTTRSARRSSRPSAGCRGTGSRAPRSGCSYAHARDDAAAAGAALEHRRARIGQRREAGALIVGQRGPSPASAARASRRRVGQRARGDVARDRRVARSGSRRRRTRRRTRSACGACAASGRGRRRTLVLFLGSNIGNFDPPGASALRARHSRGSFVRATRCCSAPTS